MAYDEIRSRVLVGIKDVLLTNKKYNVVIEGKDQRSGDEYILLHFNDSNTVRQQLGAHTQRAEVYVEYYSNESDIDTDAILHEMDVIQDLLQRNSVKRDSSSNLQYFQGLIDTVDPNPTEEDGWVFRITYSASHTKVY